MPIMLKEIKMLPWKSDSQMKDPSLGMQMQLTSESNQLPNLFTYCSALFICRIYKYFLLNKFSIFKINSFYLFKEILIFAKLYNKTKRPFFMCKCLDK